MNQPKTLRLDELLSPLALKLLNENRYVSFQLVDKEGAVITNLNSLEITDIALVGWFYRKDKP